MKDNYLILKKALKKVGGKSFTVIAFFLVLLFTIQARVFAGALPVRKGKLRVSVSASYFVAYSYWDKNSKLIHFPANGHFSAYGLSVLAEYGLTRRLTLVAQLPYTYISNVQQSYKVSTSGLGDGEVGLRYYLANIDYRYYFAVQGSAIVPLYSNRNLGYDVFGDEFKLLGFESGKIGTHTYYIAAEAGIAQYFDHTGPFQYRYSGTAGYVLDKHSQIAVGLAGTISKSTNEGFSSNLIQNRDFYYHLVSFNYGYTVNRYLTLFAGYSLLYAGNNTGKGSNVSLSANIKF